MLAQALLQPSRTAFRHIPAATCTARAAAAVTAAARGLSGGTLYSCAQILDPFPFEDISKRPPIWTPAGVKRRLQVYKGHMKSSLAASLIQHRCPGFTPKTFPPIANKVFTDFLDAHRKADLSGLAYLATEPMFEHVKTDVSFKGGRGAGARKAPPSRAAFRLLRLTQPTYILQMRQAAEKGSKGERGWGQITCQFVSEREIVMVDHRGREVPPATGTNRVVEGITVGVLEVFYGDPQHRWRLAMLDEVGQIGTGTGTRVGDESAS